MSEEQRLPEQLPVVFTAEQIQQRVREMARQISADYAGKTLHVVCVLENGFVFAADLIRQLDIPVVCHFVQPFIREKLDGNLASTEIFFSPEMQVSGHETLLVEGLIHSGLTTEFLLRTLLTRGAVSAQLAVMLDRQSQRRVSLRPDYFGFLIDSRFVVGYGLGGPVLGRNLPHIASFDHGLHTGI